MKITCSCCDFELPAQVGIVDLDQECPQCANDGDAPRADACIHQFWEVRRSGHEEETGR